MTPIIETTEDLSETKLLQLKHDLVLAIKEQSAHLKTLKTRVKRIITLDIHWLLPVPYECIEVCNQLGLRWEVRITDKQLSFIFCRA